MNLPDTSTIIFGAGTIGVVLFLAFFEWRRYRLHQTESEDGIVYPLSRLLRREAVLFLILAIVIGFALRPADLPPSTELIWVGVCLIGSILVVWLAIRDLRETSASMAQLREQFQKNTAEDLQKIYDEALAQSKSSEGTE